MPANEWRWNSKDEGVDAFQVDGKWSYELPRCSPTDFPGVIGIVHPLLFRADWRPMEEECARLAKLHNITIHLICKDHWTYISVLEPPSAWLSDCDSYAKTTADGKYRFVSAS